MSNSYASVNLASKHRPRSFATLTGQKHVIAVLRRAVLDGKVPQQLLFSGGSGLGKTTVARILATALLCGTPLDERVDGDACGTCPSCLAVLEERHPDLIEFDAASNGGKDEIRELATRAQVTPLLSKRRIYIIDEAHGLSAPGGQAFLKLLEEPPAHVIFMLCTTDPQKMLKTNRGRCTEFELLPPSRDELVRNLSNICEREQWGCLQEVLDLVIDCTDPDLGVRGTVNTLSKLTPLFADSTVDIDRAALLLGRASVQIIDRLIDACRSGDPVTASNMLIELRANSSDEAIRVTLLDRTRVMYMNSLQSEDKIEQAAALSSFEELVILPRGRQWLDLYVFRAASATMDNSHVTQIHQTAKPSLLQTSPTPLSTNQKQNSTLTKAELSVTSVSTQTQSDTEATVEQVKSAKPTGFAVTDRTTQQRRSGSESQPSSTAPQKHNLEHIAPKDAGKATVVSPVLNTPTNVVKNKVEPSQLDKVAAFIAAITVEDPDLAGTLRRCKVLISDEVEVTYPPEFHEEVSAGSRTLRVIAGRAGMAINVRRSDNEA